MFHRIFHERLKRQRRQCPAEVPFRYLRLDKQLALVTQFKQIFVRLQKSHLVAQRGHAALARLDDVTEGIRQPVDIYERIVVLVLPYEHGERIERIEKEMGIHLVDEYVVPRPQVLGLQTFVLDRHPLLQDYQFVYLAVERHHRKHERTLEQHHRIEQAPGGQYDFHVTRTVHIGSQKIDDDRDDESGQQPLGKTARAYLAFAQIVGEYSKQDERHCHIKQHFEHHEQRTVLRHRMFGRHPRRPVQNHEDEV